MKKIVSLILLFVCLFSLSSCAIIPAYDGVDLERILINNGYEIEDVNDTEHTGVAGYITEHTGVAGYIYASNGDEELYYIYCKDFATTKAIYKYIKGNIDIKTSDLKTQIKEVELKLEYSGASASDKGKYYEEYILLTEELAEVQNYGCGHGLNVVWFGTKQAIKDIRFGK